MTNAAALKFPSLMQKPMTPNSKAINISTMLALLEYAAMIIKIVFITPFGKKINDFLFIY